MEEIIINKGRLKNDEITEVIDKARIILRNKKTKEIILTRFNRVYFLPGGKIEDKEKVLNTIIREVKEETNIDVTLDSDEPFIKVKHYLRDYVLPDNTVNNRLVNRNPWEVRRSLRSALRLFTYNSYKHRAMFSPFWCIY